MNHESVAALQKRHGSPQVHVVNPNVPQCAAQPLLMCTSASFTPKFSPPCDARCWWLRLQLETSWRQTVYLNWVILNC